MSSPPPAPVQPVSLFAIYRLTFIVGLLSFGGGLSAWMRREVVLIRGWMTDEEFFNGYSLAQIIPGVNSTNMSVYIGQHLRGAVGGAVALTGLLSGPFFIVIGAAAAYHHLVAIPGFQIAMGGLAAAAVGMMFQMGLASNRTLHRHIPSMLVLLATFLAVGIMRWPLLPVLAVLAPISIAASWPRKSDDA
jgi:chromate transporter